MGLFSFVGKALGSVAKIGLGLIPGGGIAKTALGLAGQLLQHKSAGPMKSTPLKYGVATAYGVPTLRAQPRPVLRNPMIQSTPAVLRASPVMPGGGIATSQGIMAPGGGLPPASYGGRSGGPKRKRRSSSSRRSSRARSGKKSRASGKRLKFGSPAWRKKYMKRSGKRGRAKR